MLLVTGVLLTPVFSAGEVLALLQGSLESQVIAYTPVYVKAGKDVLMALLVVIGLLRVALAGTTNRLAMPFLVLFAYTALAATLASARPAIALAGLRWIMPVVTAFFMYEFVDDQLLRQLARVLSGLVFTQFAIQLAQLFLMSHWFGGNVFGLAARVPGFFLIPNTAAFFAVVALFFAHFYAPRGVARTATYSVVPASVLLTQSGTGVIALALVAALITVGTKRAWLMVPLGVGVIAGLFPVLSLVTGRGRDYVQVSGGTRVRIFADLVSHSEWLPSSFGYVTNTAVSMIANGAIDLRTDTAPIIADSTYASILGNLGLGGALFFAAFAVSWVVVVACSRRLDLYIATVIFGMFGATTIVFEAYPMNLLLAACAAYFLKRSYLPFWLGHSGALVRVPTLHVSPGEPVHRHPGDQHG